MERPQDTFCLFRYRCYHTWGIRMDEHNLVKKSFLDVKLRQTEGGINELVFTQGDDIKARVEFDFILHYRNKPHLSTQLIGHDGKSVMSIKDREIVDALKKVDNSLFH